MIITIEEKKNKNNEPEKPGVRAAIFLASSSLSMSVFILFRCTLNIDALYVCVDEFMYFKIIESDIIEILKN